VLARRLGRRNALQMLIWVTLRSRAQMAQVDVQSGQDRLYRVACTPCAHPTNPMLAFPPCGWRRRRIEV
jgi:hypothetical protein